MTETANGLGRALAAEFIGTFALIFIGAGAAIALGGNHDPPVAPGRSHRTSRRGCSCQRERAALTIGWRTPDYNGSK